MTVNVVGTSPVGVSVVGSNQVGVGVGVGACDDASCLMCAV